MKHNNVKIAVACIIIIHISIILFSLNRVESDSVPASKNTQCVIRIEFISDWYGFNNQLLYLVMIQKYRRMFFPKCKLHVRDFRMIPIHNLILNVLPAEMLINTTIPEFLQVYDPKPFNDSEAVEITLEELKNLNPDKGRFILLEEYEVWDEMFVRWIVDIRTENHIVDKDWNRVIFADWIQNIYRQIAYHHPKLKDAVGIHLRLGDFKRHCAHRLPHPIQDVWYGCYVDSEKYVLHLV